MSESSDLGDLIQFVTPTEIKNYVNNVAGGFAALGKDIKASHSLTPAQQEAWALLLVNFTKFYDSVGFFATLSMGTMRTAEEYARQLTQWREIFRKATGREPTGASVSIPNDAVAASVKTLLVIAGLGVAVYALATLRPVIQAIPVHPTRRELVK